MMTWTKLIKDNNYRTGTCKKKCWRGQACDQFDGPIVWEEDWMAYTNLIMFHKQLGRLWTSSLALFFSNVSVTQWRDQSAMKRTFHSLTVDFMKVGPKAALHCCRIKIVKLFEGPTNLLLSYVFITLWCNTLNALFWVSLLREKRSSWGEMSGTVLKYVTLVTVELEVKKLRGSGLFLCLF